MKFAIINGVRKIAEPKEVGKCICCNNEVRAYCGLERVHHWKHLNAIKCDSWSEGETEWHREWKNYFELSQQEIVKYDPKTGEKHIADVYIEAKNLVIEFQHSPIHFDEIKARESFYRKMIWVIDIKPNKESISFHKDIGDAFEKYIIEPLWNKKIKQISELYKQGKLEDAEALGNDDKEINYFKSIEDKYFPDYFSKSLKAASARNVIRFLEDQKKLNPNIEGYSFSEENMNRQKNFEKEHLNHDYLLMIWKFKHQRWNIAESYLFFDLGDDYIYRSIENIKYGNGLIVKKYSKKLFVNHYKEKVNHQTK